MYRTFALSNSLALAMPSLAILGFSIICTVASSNMLIQSFVGDDMRGRVMALFTMAFLGISPLGSLLGGWIAHRVGPRDTLLGCAFVMFLVGVVFFRTWSSTIDPTDQR